MSRLNHLALAAAAVLCLADGHSSPQELIEELNLQIEDIRIQTLRAMETTEIAKKETKKQIQRRAELEAQTAKSKQKQAQQEQRIAQLEQQILEFRLARESLKVPCDGESSRRIDDARAGVISSLSSIRGATEILWGSQADSNYPEDPAFWDKFQLELDSAQVFCPVVIPEGAADTLARIVDFPKGVNPGSFAVFAVPFMDSCDLEDSMAHETAHLASGQRHEFGKPDDWISYIGESANYKCWERYHTGKTKR